MTNVSRTNRNAARPRSDHYGTPAIATRALLAAVKIPGLTIWEPAAGRGAIVAELKAAGFKVIATDKYRYAGVAGGRDFLRARKRRAGVIVTNPPYGELVDGKRKNLVDRFIRHALELGPELAAFFLPLTFWAGLDRSDLLEGAVGGRRLSEVLIFRDRLTLTPHGFDDRPDRRRKRPAKGVVAFAWFIWRRYHVGVPIVRRITGAQ
jgi:hypothetical protein